MSLLAFCTTALRFRRAAVAAGSPAFLVIMAQGRSGSTLLLRMLNAVPGVRIAGENQKALDHLRAFVDCFRYADRWNRESDFCRQAWKLPCPLDVLKRRTAEFLLDVYDPNRAHRLFGFKEIRYGRSSYDDLRADIDFLHELVPNLRIVFNTRRTDDAIQSSFWEEDPAESRRILDASLDSFLRYHREHPDFTYVMPYEDLRDGSPVLRGLFDFLGLELTRAARAQLAIKLR